MKSKMAAGKNQRGRAGQGRIRRASPPEAAAARRWRNKKLSEALLLIHQFSETRDLSLLKGKRFLDLCGVQAIEWEGGEGLFREAFQAEGALLKGSPAEENPLKAGPFPHKLVCPASFKGESFGRLVFFSSQKISAANKRLLQKISLCAAAAMRFAARRQNLEAQKTHWEAVFDSFHQPLCITDRQFKALRANRSFARLARKSKGEIFGESALGIFPFPLDKPPDEGRPPDGKAPESGRLGGPFRDSWLIRRHLRGRLLCWRVSVQAIVLKNERLPLKLLLVEDISKQTEMEEALSRQARERELGFIKGSLAHELNSPLASAKTMMHVIETGLEAGLEGGFGERPGGRPSKQARRMRESLSGIKQALGQCQSIVSGLLEASRGAEPLDGGEISGAAPD